MKYPFILSCESTVDMPYAYINGRDIPVIFYSYYIGEEAYPDDMHRDPQALERFYQQLKEGHLPTTSQINEFAYEEFFDEQLQKGDLLHIVFSSGLTQSIRNAERAAERMREKYPDRRIAVIDSLCGSAGYGMLVDGAADRRDEGCSLDETAEWVTANRQRVHHEFFSTRLDFFKRSGRLSGPTAMLATVLNLCPVMRLDLEGHIVAYDKARGKMGAIKALVDTMEKHADGGRGYSGKCYINHSNCPADAIKVLEAIRERFPRISGEIRVFDIGTILASHCGPGTVAVYFMGDERTPSKTKEKK